MKNLISSNDRTIVLKARSLFTTVFTALLLLQAFTICTSALASDSPDLVITQQNGGIRLNWTAPENQGRWLILRDEDPYFLEPDTLAISSDTTWFDPEGMEFEGKHRFYRVFPWVPDTTPLNDIVVADFNVAVPTLTSYLDFDTNPNVTFPEEGPDNSRCISLTDDSWKVMQIESVEIDPSIIWSVDALASEEGNMQMIGFGDGSDEMWYILWGHYAPNTDSMITTYQGYFPADNEWRTFHLPIGEDWHGRFGSNTSIDRVFLVNDQYSEDEPGVVLFDNIRNSTNSMPLTPDPVFEWRWGDMVGTDSIEVHFTNYTLDSDSRRLTFQWSFGDGGYSLEEHPTHIYPKGGRWDVTMTVTDDTDYWDFITTTIEDDPVTLTGRTFDITCAGDLMMGRNVANDIISDIGYDAIFDSVKSIIEAADISMINLESPLTFSSDRHPTKSIVFKGLPEYAEGLIYAGFDFATLANNHILDYMVPGMVETMDALDDINMPWAGAGLNDVLARRPVFLNYRDVSVAVAAFCNRDGHYNNSQPFLEAGRSRPGFAMWNRSAIEMMAPQLAEESDLLVFQVHCGSEYSRIPRDGDIVAELSPGEVEPDDPYITFSIHPDSSEVAIRHYAIDMGVDLLICHHPHIIHGMEIYNGKLIAHSLGNFLFDLSYNETMHTMILNVHVGENGPDDATITPIWLNDFLPQVARGEFGNNILDYVTHYSRLLDTYVVRHPGEDVAHVLWDTTSWRDSSFDTIRVELYGFEDNSRSRPFKIPGEGYISSIAVLEDMNETKIRYGRDILMWANMEDEGAEPWRVNTSYETYNDEEYHGGERSVRISLPASISSNYVTDFNRFVKIDNGYSHSLLGWAKSENSTGTNFQVRFHRSRSGNHDLQSNTPLLTGDNGWTPLFEDVDSIANNINFINIRCNLEEPGTQTSTSWYDDVAFIQWNGWFDQTSEDGIEVPYPSGFRFVQIEAETENDSITVVVKREWISSLPD